MTNIKTLPVETTLDAIAASQLVITESMHGAILADTFRIPHIPIRTSPHILEFKWQDWAGTVGIDHRFETFPALRDKGGVQTGAGIDDVRQRILWLIRHGHRRLSPEQQFRVACERMDEALSDLRASV